MPKTLKQVFANEYVYNLHHIPECVYGDRDYLGVNTTENKLL